MDALDQGRANSGSGTTMNSIYGRWLGQMGHSGDFARWPHLGPIRPMDAGGGHLGPLSYVYGYRGGVGRRGVGQDTTHWGRWHQNTGTGRALSAHSMALRSGFRAEIGHFRDAPMWVNGKTADLAEKIKPLFWASGRS